MAERVRHRVAGAGLRGARKAVMAALLELLCGRWSKVTDNRMRLSHIVNEIADTGGRRYDRKTIGRALSGLAAEELISYRAAQGRGGFAEVAIHRQFLTDIKVLQRDINGRVITDPVTFSQPPLSFYPKGLPHYSPNSHSGTETSQPRPTEVEVSSEELRWVLANLPEPMATLPRHLRWLLGKEIRAKLAKGFRPNQILRILGARMPEQVDAPWRLARWRLKMNMTGSGPRLRPLQTAWDQAQQDQTRAAAERSNTRWYDRVYANTTTADRHKILAAHTAKFGAPSTNPAVALGQAGRRASTLHPNLDLRSALRRWCTDTLNQPPTAAPATEVAPPPEAGGLLADLLAGGCVKCPQSHAEVREELPMPMPVCDRCWPEVLAQLQAPELDDDQLVA